MLFRSVVCNLEGLVLAQVEALAARRAIELPIELGFIRIILEGDFFCYHHSSQQR